MAHTCSKTFQDFSPDIFAVNISVTRFQLRQEGSKSVDLTSRLVFILPVECIQNKTVSPSWERPLFLFICRGNIRRSSHFLPSLFRSECPTREKALSLIRSPAERKLTFLAPVQSSKSCKTGGTVSHSEPCRMKSSITWPEYRALVIITRKELQSILMGHLVRGKSASLPKPTHLEPPHQQQWHIHPQFDWAVLYSS